MSYSFEPVRQLGVGEDVSGISNGVFAFAIQSLSCEDVAHPRVTLRLHSDAEGDHETVVEEEWESMKCIKRLQFFKVGDLTGDELITVDRGCDHSVDRRLLTWTADLDLDILTSGSWAGRWQSTCHSRWRPVRSPR